MAVLGHRTYLYTVEIYRDGVKGNAGETQTHAWEITAEDSDDADLKMSTRADETIRPLIDSYRVASVAVLVPKDPTHYHVHIHSGQTPASVVGWGTAWATLGDAVNDVRGSLGARGDGQRVALVTCEDPSCWS
ncbi:hypothetical protein ACFWY5_29820 [Nonomuraea sp. NPDC059007]|uniref:hypothetical protein n=1 Tax=Nonomuraea sp. NPDC059007 TaxID=3346692 RepID=UPI0036A6059F